MTDPEITTREWIAKFDQAIADFHIASLIKSTGIHPIIAKAQLDGMKSMREDLINQLKKDSQWARKIQK